MRSLKVRSCGSGDRVRINAQLIDARTDRHLWASAYDRNLRDVLALQSDLASAIANQVASRVDRQNQPNIAKTLNPEAYDAYLRGRQECNPMVIPNFSHLSHPKK